MERVLTTCLIASVLVAGVLANNNNKNNNNPLIGEESSTMRKRFYTDDICITPACVHTASRVLSNMDTAAKPCDSFYSFACGQFVRNTNIPDDRSYLSTTSQVEDMVDNQLRKILEEPMNATELRPVTKAKKLYKACITTTMIESLGLAPIKNILKDLGGWPVLEGNDWNHKDFNWLSSVYKLKRLGISINSLLGFGVDSDAKNRTQRLLSFDQARLGLSREFLMKGSTDKRVSAYLTYQTDIAVILGASRECASIELQEALEFEIALANISMSSEARRNGTLLYNSMTIGEMQTRYPSIPWLEYVNNILPKQIQVNMSEVVMVYNPNYISELETLLATTDKRIQANYVFWRVAKSMVSSSTQEMLSALLKYSTAASGVLSDPPRWKKCTAVVTKAFSLAIGSMYVKRYFNETAKHAALEMVTDIRESFIDILTTVDWMDETTRTKALAKAKSMLAYIAYPDELLDDNKIKEFFTKLEVDEGMFLESMLNVSKFGHEYTLSRFREPVNKTDWKSHSKVVDVNALYSGSENSIQFPAGILQRSFFNSEVPKYMNYGAIGSVIGHEITHGFDDKGHQFDGDGNLVDWWDPETREKFLKKATCIIEQYGNFTEPATGLKLNGIKTQGENIADNGGIKEAYMAYTRWSEQQKAPEPRLPGLEWLSPRQMFWVAAAQIWCSTSRVESLRKSITTGNHPPRQFRVDGPFSNAEQFARDFNCPVGSNMNPKHRCNVW